MKNLSTRFVTFFVLLTLLSVELVDAQRNTRWQQEIAYTMDIKVDAEAHQYTGTQQVVYTNNSPDVITKVYYHLFFNAFQPGSMMDVRSLTIADPDRRVRDRISKLQPVHRGRNYFSRRISRTSSTWPKHDISDGNGGASPSSNSPFRSR